MSAAAEKPSLSRIAFAVHDIVDVRKAWCTGCSDNTYHEFYYEHKICLRCYEINLPEPPAVMTAGQEIEWHG